MTRGKGRKVTEDGRSLSIGERDDIKGLKQEAEATLRHLEANPGTARDDSIDKSKLKREIEQYNNILSNNGPTEARGLNKDRMVARARELSEKLQINMPTREQMDHPARNPGAVRKHLIWSKNNEGMIREYKELQRRLEPDDPTATDLEKLRREK